jgi:SAM-dependent methyltransferase
MIPAAMPPQTKDVTELNRAAYATGRILSSYQSAQGLTDAEKQIFARHCDPAQLGPGSVLDMGIGAGRTCTALSALGRPYVGFDFVPAMVEAARRTYPNLDLRVMDARKLDGLAPGSIALAVFSFNGIDSTGGEHRETVLAEVARVLAPGGLFIFSSHNLAFARLAQRTHPAWPKLSLTAPEQSLRRLVAYARSRKAAKELARLQWRSKGIAVLNDDAHGHALLQCYIEPGYQAELLEHAGFDVVEIADHTGKPGAPGHDFSSSDSVHYVARKRT